MVQTSTEQHARTRKTAPSPSFTLQNAAGRGALPCLLSRLFICSCILRVRESAALLFLHCGTDLWDCVQQARSKDSTAFTHP